MSSPLRSFRHDFGYKKIVGRPDSNAAFRSPAASAASAGMSTSMPGHMGQDRFEGLRVERPEPGPIAAARGHDDDRALPAAVRPPVHAAQLGDDLIERQGEEVGELDEGHGPSPGEGLADR